MASVLIVDDEKHIRSHLATYVRGLGHSCDAVASGEEALAVLRARGFDLVLSDVRMAGLGGLELLAEIRRRSPDTLVVLMTAYATVPQAVEAMRAGAYDYLVKPFSLDEIGLVLGRALELRDLRRENRRLRLAADDVLLESDSPAMKRALELARQVAASDATLLLTGESGTGKTVLARQVHAWSARRGKPFVTIACTTLSEHLLESELFGHVKGAFTGAWKDNPGRLEAAAGGTVFLDEVGELPLEIQAKLLRFLEERRFERVGGRTTIEIDARLIAATNRDLGSEVAARRFREDLFFRLNVIGIRLPALRERREDLPRLVDHLLASLAARHGRDRAPVPSPAARRAIDGYAWPGNVRELVNALERAIVLSTGDVIEPEALPDAVLAPPSSDGRAATVHAAGSLEDVERAHIQQVLAESSTLEQAAARLGIGVTTLWRKRKRYGIE
ncbi:MAG: sigma-54 dependent transcriptional regulator [Thermodesulfobacteriota bacterium]